MNILIADAFFSNPWVWPFRNGFKKLGHDVRWIGWGGSGDADYQEVGLVNDFESSKILYTAEELTRFTYNHRWRLDVPLFDFGQSFDGHICYYDWDTVDREVRRCLGDNWLPDLILMFEMSFSFYGDRPKRWQGIPVGYMICDNRGIDEHLRKMQRSGAVFCCPVFEWNWPLYKYYGANPIMVLFPCIDTDIFYPQPDIQEEVDVFYSGGNGMDLNPLPCESTAHPIYDWVSTKWDIADFRIPKAKLYDQRFGEYAHRAEVIKTLMLAREFSFGYYSSFSKPRNWAKGFHLGKISLCPQGGLFPYLCVPNGRMVASTASGRLTLISDTHGLKDFYTIGEEVIVYRHNSHVAHHDFSWFDARALKDIICYYLVHDKERNEIAANGLKATIERHECKVRAKEVLDAIQQAGILV